MGALYRHIGLAIGTALLVAGFAGFLSSHQLGVRAMAHSESLLKRGGIRIVIHQLEQSPQPRWSEIVEAARTHVDFDMTIAPADEAVPPSREYAATLSIGETGYVLRLGPSIMPPIEPILLPIFVFVSTFLLASAAILALPLAHHLRRTQHAIHLLGEGRWDVRLNVEAEGALRSLAQHVNSMAEKLAETFKEREELLQAVSHELGTPLQRIRFQLALLEPDISKTQLRQVEHILRDLDELDDMSQDLVSWMDAATPNERMSTLHIHEILSYLIELNTQHIDDLEVVSDVPTEIDVCAHPRKFQTAIENLLRNAVRYARSLVVVSARTTHEGVWVEVRDDGIGIPADQRDRLLQPFARIEKSRSKGEGGLGLGLAVVQRITQAHGGDVCITDAPEGGACVRTLWPRPLEHISERPLSEGDNVRERSSAKESREAD